MAQLFVSPFLPAFTTLGAVAPGATLTFYDTGTSNLVDVWADAALTNVLDNPVIADSAGWFPPIFLNSDLGYRIVLKTAGGAIIDEVEDYTVGALELRQDLATGTGSDLIGYQLSATGAQARTVRDKMGESVSLLDFMTSAQRTDYLGSTMLSDLTVPWQAFVTHLGTTGRRGLVPAGRAKTTSAIVCGTPIVLEGVGFDITAESGSIIHAMQTSGAAFEFNNTEGSFDNGLIVENIMVRGNAGTTKGWAFEGVVWPHSQINGLGAKLMGGAGFDFADCLSANIEDCRAQQNGAEGYLIKRSNALRILTCTAETNGSHGFFMDTDGIIGERAGAALIECLSEENVGDALRIEDYAGVKVIGGYYQIAAASNLQYASIRLIGSRWCSIIGAALRTNIPWANFAGVQHVGSSYNTVIGNNFMKLAVGDGFDTGREIVEDGASGYNFHDGNRGGGAEGQARFTTSSATSYYGGSPISGGGNKAHARVHEWAALNGDVLARFHSVDGNLLSPTGGKVGFYGATPAAKPTVTGSRGANAALASLLTQLATLGLLTDSSS